MILDTELKLYFLGNRDYVNGLTLFEEALKAVFLNLNYKPSKTVVEQFKVTNFIRNHAHLELFHLNDEQQRLKLKDASSLIDLNIEDDIYRILLFSVFKEEKPPLKPEYDRAVYVKRDNHYKDGKSEAIIHNVQNSYDLLRGIIEVNQRFTVTHAPLTGFTKAKYWAYMTGYRLLNCDKIPGEIEVNYRLKQVIPQLERTMIIREVNVPILGKNNHFDLCFFG